MESPRSVGLINVITLIKNDCTKMRSGSKGTFNLVLSVTGSQNKFFLARSIIRSGLHSGLHRQHQLWMESFRFRPQHNHRVLRQETKLSQCSSPLRDAHEYQQPLRKTWRSNRCGGEGGGKGSSSKLWWTSILNQRNNNAQSHLMPQETELVIIN